MILVVGGAGYFASHTNKFLEKSGYKTVVLDNLVNGHKSSVKWGEFVLGDLCNIEQLRLVFSSYEIEAVMHFAAYAYVGESVLDPEKYYFNNVSNTLNLLKVMKEFDCKKIVFSSTCATYGAPVAAEIDESHPQVPINPYGQSKLMIEKILVDFSKAYGFKYVFLRYFNAAGCDLDGEIGESHDPETHLIPIILDVAIGKRQKIEVFGTDYETPDGTAIRDYVHVTDLAEAHVLAYEYLARGGKSDAFNLGNGKGYSVLEVINAVKDVTKREFDVIHSGRRDGDPEILISNSFKSREVLGWRPKNQSLEVIIRTAWDWHQKLTQINETN